MRSAAALLLFWTADSCRGQQPPVPLPLRPNRPTVTNNAETTSLEYSTLSLELPLLPGSSRFSGCSSSVYSVIWNWIRLAILGSTMHLCIMCA